MRIVVLIALALTHTSTLAIWGGFLAYAASLAFTEGAERALIGDVAPAQQKATAFGLYHMVTGLAALPGAILFGALWQWAGDTVALFTAATLSLLAVIALLVISRRQK